MTELQRSKRQIKQEAKRSLEEIKRSLKRIQKTHLFILSISVVYWLLMIILCHRSLNCTEHWREIVNIAEYRENDREGLMYHKSVALQYAERLEDVHIEKLVDHNCVSKDFENSTYTMESNTMDDVCASMCVPLPYQDNAVIPNALDWYSPLRWWDMAFLAVAGVIQFRLRSIETGDTYGSYGPLVVDEKDIAITSTQLLTIIMSAFFYSIELGISSLWLTLHNQDTLHTEHASYYTVLERNKMLVITNSIWLVCIVPMFGIAYKIKTQIQKYEQNQFLTEL